MEAEELYDLSLRDKEEYYQLLTNSTLKEFRVKIQSKLESFNNKPKLKFNIQGLYALDSSIEYNIKVLLKNIREVYDQNN